MVNEEISQKTCNLAVQVSKVTVKTLEQALQKYAHNLQKKVLDASAKKKQPIQGKQSVKQLVQQGQGVTTIDIGDKDIKDFQKLAKKYGVDFAIVKDKNKTPPLYTVFFKAKDQDAITNLIGAYTAKRMKQRSNPKQSILQKLEKFKAIVAKRSVKQKTKKKEQTR